MYSKYGVKGAMGKRAWSKKGRIARNRARALQILAEKAAAKMIKQKALSVVNKKKLATLPGVVTKHLYRKFCTMADQQSTLWKGLDGQLMIDPAAVADKAGEVYIDKISHAPFYHKQWLCQTQPGEFERFINHAVNGETIETFMFPNELAGLSTYDRGVPPGITTNTKDLGTAIGADNWYFDTGMDPHRDIARHFGYREAVVDILPRIYHEGQLQGVIDKNHEYLNPSPPQTPTGNWDRQIDEWARCLPSRSTDQVKIKNFYIKFDFDTKFYGDEGERTNYIRARDVKDDPNVVLRNVVANAPSLTYEQQIEPVHVGDKPGKRSVVSLNNRIPNMFAKVRVIIGKRKVFGKTAIERVSLHNLLKTDDDRMYERGVSDEEYLSDLFSRQNLRDKKKTYGVTHRTIDEDEYSDITIVKDEVITLGRGHSVKTFNVFKNHILTYPSTEQNNGLLVDPIEEVDSNAEFVVNNTPTTTNFDIFGYQKFDINDISSDDPRVKLTIPLENDMFMYVLNFTHGAAVNWRLTTKLSYHSC